MLFARLYLLLARRRYSRKAPGRSRSRPAARDSGGGYAPDSDSVLFRVATVQQPSGRRCAGASCPTKNTYGASAPISACDCGPSGPRLVEGYVGTAFVMDTERTASAASLEHCLENQAGRGRDCRRAGSDSRRRHHVQFIGVGHAPCPRRPITTCARFLGRLS